MALADGFPYHRGRNSGSVSGGLMEDDLTGPVFFELGERLAARARGQPVDVEEAVEAVGLMLEAAGECPCRSR
jgi:hypothetical protein